MLWRFGKEKPDLDKPINRVLTEMEHYGPDAPEYPVMVKHLSKLIKLKEVNRKRISPDTILIVVGNIAGILAIVAYEQRHAMVSKGLGFIIKPK